LPGRDHLLLTGSLQAALAAPGLEAWAVEPESDLGWTTDQVDV